MKKGFKITSFVLLAILITTLLCISILHYNKEFTSDDVNVAYANGLSVGEVASEKALNGIRNEFTSADETLRNEFTSEDETLRNEFNSADEELRTLINSSASPTYYSHYVTIHFDWNTMEELQLYIGMTIFFTIINQSEEAFTLETLYEYFAINFNDANNRFLNANSDLVATKDNGIIVERKMSASLNNKKINIQFQIVKFSLDENNALTSNNSFVSYSVSGDNVIQDNVVAL